MRIWWCSAKRNQGEDVAITKVGLWSAKAPKKALRPWKTNFRACSILWAYYHWSNLLHKSVIFMLSELWIKHTNSNVCLLLLLLVKACFLFIYDTKNLQTTFLEVFWLDKAYSTHLLFITRIQLLKNQPSVMCIFMKVLIGNSCD